MLDKAKEVRKGEELNQESLENYFKKVIPDFRSIDAIRQFPGGFSNLTYLLKTNLGEWVLRRPPHGANIKSAHDMSREFRVLEKLQGIYGRIPRAIHYCDDVNILGSSFYLMERVQGLILRNRPPKGYDLNPARMQAISQAAVDNLALLHQIDINVTGLHELGKTQGYVDRQVSGWIKRYKNAQTDEISSMDAIADWMVANQPADGCPGLIHNDYKYDNLVLDVNEPARILAVLDWEMATTGDTRMDLGTSLAYWTEASEVGMVEMGIGNLSWMPGNLSRQEMVERYANTTGHNLDNVLFYFVFGTFKISVIAQQIYARWKKGMTKDPRFEHLIHVVKYLAKTGSTAIDKDRISDLLSSK